MMNIYRLWIRRKDGDEDEQEMINESGQFAITLKYLDFVPQRQNGNAFESIDDLLARVNERLRQPDAAKWNMVTLQSLKIEANSDWNMGDVEVSLAEESSRHLIILRLYYEEYNYSDSGMWPTSANKVAVIGFEDFKPRHLSGGSFFKRPQFEPFSSLVQRAGKWLTNQTGIHFMNAQSIDIKVKSCKSLKHIHSHIYTCIHTQSSTHTNYKRTLIIMYILWCFTIIKKNFQCQESIRERAPTLSTATLFRCCVSSSLGLCHRNQHRPSTDPGHVRHNWPTTTHARKRRQLHHCHSARR